MTDPIDPTADTLHVALEALRNKYRRKRRTWAREVGLPYSNDIDKPEPGVLDLAAEEDG